MQRCLQLAANGLGTTYPNPLVGSVIVHNGFIIGEGWHRKSGEPHAEIMAINSVKNPELLSDSTLYVNLEPCSHFGKTPPCAHKIVELGIPEVIIGKTDAAAHVNGAGIKYLMDNGVQVTVGVLEEACKYINRRFFTFHTLKRPYIILKFGQTKNGFMAPTDGSQKWITNRFSKQLVHKWRTEEQAILIGKYTAIADKPQLNARLWNSDKQPLRLLISKNAAEVQDFVAKQDGIIFTSEKGLNASENYVQLDFDSDVIPQVLEYLYSLNIQSVIIEGGAVTLQYFIESNLWDEARILTSDSVWEEGVKAPALPDSALISTEKIADNTLEIFVNCGR